MNDAHRSPSAEALDALIAAQPPRQVIVYQDESGAFCVIVPSLPGCFTSGDTLEEALAMAGDAMACWLDAVDRDGEGLPASDPPIHVASVKPQFLEDRTDRFRKSPEQVAADRADDARMMREIDAELAVEAEAIAQAVAETAAA